MKRNLILCFISVIFLFSCSKSGLSDRDAKREQLRSSGETKRKELEVVAGEYNGQLTQDNGSAQNISLKLEVKDIPTTAEGQVDPVLMPILTGYARFNLTGGQEYIGFSIEKAEYDPKLEKVNIVATNSLYKDLILSLKRNMNDLEGTWTAPSSATSGKIHVSRLSNLNTPVAEALRGEYTGLLFRENENQYQLGQLTVTTSVQPPEGLKVSAIFKLVFGDWNSSEYLTYRFETVQFNPVNGQFTMKSDQADVLFVGSVSSGEINGEWFSNYTGRLGKAVFKKSNTAPALPSEGTLFEALRGTYQGELKNTNTQSNLPERVLVSYVTSQDLSQANGIKVTGNIRFYFGSFGSLEYYEMPLVGIQYNFFTKKLVAKTEGDYKLTIKADVFSKKITGKIFSDALGEVANMEVTKQ